MTCAAGGRWSAVSGQQGPGGPSSPERAQLAAGRHGISAHLEPRRGRFPLRRAGGGVPARGHMSGPVGARPRLCKLGATASVVKVISRRPAPLARSPVGMQLECKPAEGCLDLLRAGALAHAQRAEKVHRRWPRALRQRAGARGPVPEGRRRQPAARSEGPHPAAVRAKRVLAPGCSPTAHAHWEIKAQGLIKGQNARSHAETRALLRDSQLFSCAAASADATKTFRGDTPCGLSSVRCSCPQRSSVHRLAL